LKRFEKLAPPPCQRKPCGSNITAGKRKRYPKKKEGFQKKPGKKIALQNPVPFQGEVGGSKGRKRGWTDGKIGGHKRNL